jgi:flagellar basal-body rod protein FlgB
VSTITQLGTAGALPALEAMIRFSGARHRIVAHNIANFETPGFTPEDVDPKAFQSALAGAIEARRADTGAGASGDLPRISTGEVEFGRSGGLRLTPRTGSGNILFHDRNNRDLERTMQSMVENAGMFRVATDLYRNRTTILREAIAERVG